MITAKNFTQRLLTFPFIRAILDEQWHAPLARVPGASNAAMLCVNAELCANTEKYSNAFSDARRYAKEHNSSALLIMHKGELVFEEYFGGYKPEQHFNSMSMMKTVLALLIGIAIDEGDIESIDTPASVYIPEWKDDARRDITIKHMLTMRSGLMSDVAFGKYINRIIPLYLGDDVSKYALECPARAKPGEKLIYNNVNSQMLGIILERASKKSYKDYLSQKLWHPLGCHDANVWEDDKGIARTFSALFARPQDWLRIGQLIMNNGLYEGQQLVPESWVRLMKQGYDKDKRYGLHIWTKAHVFDRCAGYPSFEYHASALPFDDEETVFLEGLRCQSLILMPSKDLIVFRMGESPKKDWDTVAMMHHVSRNLV